MRDTICKVCNKEFDDINTMYKFYKGYMITCDMYKCSKCKTQYGSGAYSSTTIYDPSKHTDKKMFDIDEFNELSEEEKDMWR